MSGETSDPGGGRHETPDERADRNMAELLQELRVLALGVQVLFGFLLAIPFATHFDRLDENQRRLYVCCLVLSVVATGALITPVAYHRAVFRLHDKPGLVALANAMTWVGLGAVGLAISSAVWLVLSTVCRGWPVPTICSIVVAFFLMLWIVMPLAARVRRRHDVT
jgi:hypothetical protein